MIKHLATHIRDRFEQTLLYQLLERHYLEFGRRMVASAALLLDGRPDPLHPVFTPNSHHCYSRWEQELAA